MPKVSVILPFYNAERFLKKAIDSVLLQSYDDFELILVNNNSTDSSRQIATKYEQKEKRIILIDENNLGVVAAMNAGLNISEGEFVARIDADDYWYTTKLQKQMDFLEQNNAVGVVGCCVDFKSEIEQSAGLEHFVKWSNNIVTSHDIKKNIFTELPIVNPSFLARTKLFDEYGLYKKGDFPEDYEIFLRWHSKGVIMAKLNESLMCWYDTEKRLTRTNSAYTVDAFNSIKCNYINKYFEQKGLNKKIWIWGAGRKTRRRAEVLLKYGFKFEGFIDIKADKTSLLTVVHFSRIDNNSQPFIISFVSNRDKREEIREYLSQKNYVELKNFIIA